MRLLTFASISLIFVACSPYSSRFDCPVPKGIPCASVTEIEAMIVERDQGPDVLCADIDGKIATEETNPLAQFVRSTTCDSQPTKRVWISTSKTPSGYTVGPHYVDLPPEENICLAL